MWDAGNRELGGRFHMGFVGSWVGRMPYRFFMVTRCRENLSSGEKRAGWAVVVTMPSTVFFLSV